MHAIAVGRPLPGTEAKYLTGLPTSKRQLDAPEGGNSRTWGNDGAAVGAPRTRYQTQEPPRFNWKPTTYQYPLDPTGQPVRVEELTPIERQRLARDEARLTSLLRYGERVKHIQQVYSAPRAPVRSFGLVQARESLERTARSGRVEDWPLMVPLIRLEEATRALKASEERRAPKR